MANRIQFDECTPDLIRDDWLFCSNAGVIARYIWHRSVDSGIFPIDACVMNTDIEIVAMDDRVHAVEDAIHVVDDYGKGRIIPFDTDIEIVAMDDRVHAVEDAIHVVDDYGKGRIIPLDKGNHDTIILWCTLICVLVVMMIWMTMRTRIAGANVHGAPPVESVAIGTTPYDHDGGMIVKEVAVGEDHVEDRHLAETPRLLPPATRDMLKTQEGINCESDVRREVDNENPEKKPAKEDAPMPLTPGARMHMMRASMVSDSTDNSESSADDDAGQKSVVIRSRPKPSGKPAAKVVCDLSNKIARSAEKKSRLPSAPMQPTSPASTVAFGSRIPRRPSKPAGR